MVFGFPVSWLLTELLSLVLFFMVLWHASRQENAGFMILAFFGFMIGAALFENAGVNVSRNYYYDLRRVMMVGSVPLEILISQWNTTHPGAMGANGMSGQWNWATPGYEGGFFGIPVYNFSGWFYLMFYFSALILLGLWLSGKFRNKGIAIATPFLAAILNVVCLATPVNVFLLFGPPCSRPEASSAKP